MQITHHGREFSRLTIEMTNADTFLYLGNYIHTYILSVSVN